MTAKPEGIRARRQESPLFSDPNTLEALADLGVATDQVQILRSQRRRLTPELLERIKAQVELWHAEATGEGLTEEMIPEYMERSLGERTLKNKV